MIYFFPGFLQDDRDKVAEIVTNTYGLNLPFEINQVSLNEMILKPHTFKVWKKNLNENSIILAYSMGGRFILSKLAELHFPFKKIILISAHIGIEDQIEKMKRTTFENEIITNLQLLADKDFLSYWNNLSLFKNDASRDRMPTQSREELIWMFQSLRLSRQTHYKDLISKYCDKLIYLHGSSDLVYSQIALEYENLGVERISLPNLSHRLINSPQCWNKIKEILLND